MPTLITYFGKRETYRDGLFETGEWKQGETKPVHDDVALKMLRHSDQYKRATLDDSASPKRHESAGAKSSAPDETETVGKKPDSQPDDEEETQSMRDSVTVMNKDALRTFAKTHFSANIDHRIGVEKMRTQVLGLIDQYGVD